MTVGGDPKTPTRPDFPFNTGSTGLTLKPGDRSVKVMGQSGSSSSSRVEVEVVATRPRSHKEGMLRKSRQLYQCYLEHHKEEGMRPWGSFASLCNYTTVTQSTSRRTGMRPLGGTGLLLLDLPRSSSSSSL